MRSGRRSAPAWWSSRRSACWSSRWDVRRELGVIEALLTLVWLLPFSLVEWTYGWRRRRQVVPRGLLTSQISSVSDGAHHCGVSPRSPSRDPDEAQLPALAGRGPALARLPAVSCPAARWVLFSQSQELALVLRVREHEGGLAAQGVEHLADEARVLGLLLVGVSFRSPPRTLPVSFFRRSGYGIQPGMPGIRPMMTSWPGRSSTAMGVNWLPRRPVGEVAPDDPECQLVEFVGDRVRASCRGGDKAHARLPEGVPPRRRRPVLKIYDFRPRCLRPGHSRHRCPRRRSSSVRGDELADAAGVGAAQADRELRVGPGWLKSSLPFSSTRMTSRVFYQAVQEGCWTARLRSSIARLRFPAFARDRPASSDWLSG